MAEADRSLSEVFMADLKSEDGKLNPLLSRIQNDDTLIAGIRNDCLDVYYRGGCLLHLTRKGEIYKAEFDENYDVDERLKNTNIPNKVKGCDDIKIWLDALPEIKDVMDMHLGLEKDKLEREFQQVVVRENNFSKVAESTEYFITDIEYADRSNPDARFDMLGVQWSAQERANPKNCRPVLIEMKFGDEALDGGSGLGKHLEDFHKILDQQESREKLICTIDNQFRQLRELGLVPFDKTGNTNDVVINSEARPEIVFILASSNPRSKKLEDVLKEHENNLLDGNNFDIRFFVSSFAGYSMHKKNMLELKDFLALLQQF